MLAARRDAAGARRHRGAARCTVSAQRHRRRAGLVPVARSRSRCRAGWRPARGSLSPGLDDPREVLAVATIALRYRPTACAHVTGSALQDLGPHDAFVTLQERGLDPGSSPADVPNARPISDRAARRPIGGFRVCAERALQRSLVWFHCRRAPLSRRRRLRPTGERNHTSRSMDRPRQPARRPRDAAELASQRVGTAPFRWKEALVAVERRTVESRRRHSDDRSFAVCARKTWQSSAFKPHVRWFESSRVLPGARQRSSEGAGLYGM